MLETECMDQHSVGLLAQPLEANQAVYKNKR